MKTQTSLPFVTLILLISFASVNAVLFTPALPDIAIFFAISPESAQLTVSWFLIGYALGQLIYGPLTSRYGRKPALYIGIFMQIIASLCCVLSGLITYFPLLVVSRFMLALGAGVGLKMTFTLVNECYPPKMASQKIAYLMLAFAITPGLGVALGGICNTYFGWMSCFMLGGMYGFLLLFLTVKLPKLTECIDKNALRLSHMQKAYAKQFMNTKILAGGLLMGSSTCFVYVFAALAPFIAMDKMGMTSQHYGVANILPSLGLMIGSIFSAQLIKKYSLFTLIKAGVGIAALGTMVMIWAVKLAYSPLLSLFVPMIIIYMGLSFILANASTLVMAKVSDKAHGSAVMNFINMGLATVTVLALGAFETNAMLLPKIYILLCIAMIPMTYWQLRKSN
jgi:MFS transporter, DHA1 family, multidrug resistance protein